jgi:hypothetical protein
MRRYDTPNLTFSVNVPLMWVIYLVHFVPFDKLRRWKYVLEPTQAAFEVTDIWFTTGAATIKYPVVSSARSRL